MATATLTPDDMVSLAEASALLRETGHPASVTTLTRWLRDAGTPLVRRGRAHQVSFSDVLVVHAARVAERGDC